jgi:hypothetical protein
VTLEDLAVSKWFRRAKAVENLYGWLAPVVLLGAVTALMAWLVLPKSLAVLGLSMPLLLVGMPGLILIGKVAAVAWMCVMVVNFVRSDFRMRAEHRFQKAVRADIAARYGLTVRAFDVPVTPGFRHTVTARSGADKKKVVLVFPTPWAPITVHPVGVAADLSTR